MRWWFRQPTVKVASKGHTDAASLRRLVFDRQTVQNSAYKDQELDEFLAISSSFKQCAFERLSIRSAYCRPRCRKCGSLGTWQVDAQGQSPDPKCQVAQVVSL